MILAARETSGKLCYSRPWRKVENGLATARIVMALNVGDKAPDLEVPAVVGDKKEKFKLSDYRGKKNVVLAFYPLDWTPV